MVDSEYSTDNYKSLKITIGAKMKNPEMLKFVPDPKICKYAAKNYLL